MGKVDGCCSASLLTFRQWSLKLQVIFSCSLLFERWSVLRLVVGAKFQALNYPSPSGTGSKNSVILSLRYELMEMDTLCGVGDVE